MIAKNKLLYVIGGISKGKVLKSVEVLDLTSPEKWEREVSMNEGRFLASSELYQGIILCNRN